MRTERAIALHLNPSESTTYERAVLARRDGLAVDPKDQALLEDIERCARDLAEADGVHAITVSDDGRVLTWTGPPEGASPCAPEDTCLKPPGAGTIWS